MSGMHCSLCGGDINRVVAVIKSADNKITDAWVLCDECEKSLTEWSLSRASGTEAKPTATPSPAKQCPFYGIGGECVRDCALRINGKCALLAMAEAMR